MPPDSSPLDVEDLRDRVHKELESFLSKQAPVLDAVGDEMQPFLEALDTLLRSGKRLRPAFAYWGWRCAGGDDCAEIVCAVAALELLQACALIHDDVMDDSDTRRGGPSTHRRFAAIHRSAGWTGSPDNFGAGAAILLGDVSLAWADEMLYDSELPDEALNRAKPTYDRMRTELMAGQYLDLVEQARGGGSVERALRVARFKSAKYTIEGPLHMGGQLAGAGADLLQRFSEYGLPLGEAFQLRDDVLGVFGDPAVTGKPAGDDLREGKRTVLIATTEERCSPAQRHLLSQHLGDRRLSESGIDDIRTVITESGALAHVEELIESLAARAQAALTGLSEPGQSVLRNLALAAVNRSL